MRATLNSAPSMRRARWRSPATCSTPRHARFRRSDNDWERAFVAALELMLQCKGRVVVSGIGKSGHVARKLAATLASTGTPAFFVHPAEAGHGDLGMITRGRRRRHAVEFRRDRRADAADAAPEASGRCVDRADRQRALLARAIGRRASGCGRRCRSVSARTRADGEHDGGAWRSAMRWRSRFSTRADSPSRISRARTRAARSDDGC